MKTRTKITIATLVGALAAVGFSPSATALAWNDFEQDPTEEYDYCTKLNGYRYCVGGNAETCEFWVQTPYAAACAENVTA